MLEKFGGLGSFIEAEFDWQCFASARNERQRRAHIDRRKAIGRLDVDIIVDNLDMTESSFVFSKQALGSEAANWTYSGMFASYGGKWGPYVPKEDRSRLSNRAKYNSVKAANCLVAHEPHVLVMYVQLMYNLETQLSLPIAESCSGIQEIALKNDVIFRKSGKSERDFRKQSKLANTQWTFQFCEDNMSFHAIFANQLFLDCLHTWGTEFERPYREFLDKPARIRKSTKNLQVFYDSKAAGAQGPRLKKDFTDHPTCSSVPATYSNIS